MNSAYRHDPASAAPAAPKPPSGAGRRPRLTIGLVVRNGAAYLGESLEALLRQTFGDFELIVSDNASSDATPQIADAYAARDERVRYLRHDEDRGAIWNYNSVARLAASEYFKWAAADDVCEPTFLERCIEQLDEDPSVVCCHSRTRKIDAVGQPIEGADDPTDGGLPIGWFASRSRRSHRPDASDDRPHRRFADVLLSSGWGVRCSGVMRAADLQSTSLLLPFYGSEKVLMAELALRGRFHDVPETLFLQRVHDAAVSQSTSARSRRRFIAPQAGVGLRRGALMQGYLRAVSRSQLPFAERLRCWRGIARYLLQIGKWPALVRLQKQT